jgi:hypothetical protein
LLATPALLRAAVKVARIGSERTDRRTVIDWSNFAAVRESAYGVG